MKFFRHIEINNDLIERITACFPTKIYKDKSVIFYAGQIPISGYLIVTGTILLSKKKHEKTLYAGTLVGLPELLARLPVQVNAEVSSNTKLCFLDRSSLLKIHQETNNTLRPFFESILENKK